MAQAIITDAESDDELVQEWLMGKAEATQEAYGRDIRQFYEWAGDEVSLEELKARKIKQWADHLESQYKRSTATRKLKALKSLVGYGYETGYLDANPGKVVHVAPTSNRFNERILPPEKIREMIGLADEGRNRIIVLTLYGLGLRASEVASLRWGDQIYKQRVKVRNSKGGRDRVLPVPDGLWEDWSRLEGEVTASGQDDFMFQNSVGNGLSRHRIWQIVKETAERTSINLDRFPVSPHWLRHCHASHAIDNGAPISLVQARLGHESVDTTTIYLHAKDEPSGNYLPVLNEHYGRPEPQEPETEEVRRAVDALVAEGVSESEVLSIVRDAFS